jgi:DNA polymerase I
MKTSRLLIDGDILTYRTCWACQTEVQWDDGIVTTATNLKELEVQAEQSLRYWQEKLGVSEYVIAFSDPRGRYFRHAILEDYKGNRKSTRKPLGYKHLVKHLKANHTSMVLPELEADDVLGILATDGTYSRNVIVSIDKDMLTIPCEYFNMDSEVTETVTETLADYMHLYQTLTGDTTDNYKGCPSVGPKKAAEILRSNDNVPFNGWSRVVQAFNKAKLTEADALVQAQVARILRADDYDFTREEVILWNPA